MIRIITSKDKEEIMRLKSRNYKNFDLAIDRVRPIIKGVKTQGDKALFYYTNKYDNLQLNKFTVKVNKEEIRYAYRQINKKTISAMKVAIKNIIKFAQLQMPNPWQKIISNGTKVGQILRPIDSVGCYVPSGNFPLASTLLMAVVTAKTAGVPNVIVCTPPRENNASIYVAGDIAGADAIYKVGGAQAIAAMAYGTESVPKVNKIIGPGNIFVTAAKKLVYGDVDIDFIAGPTEVIIYSENGNKKFIAADMLAQAEHDRLAMSLFITPNKSLADNVKAELEEQLKDLQTKATALESLSNFGTIIIVENINEAAEIINELAPEHLEIFDNEKRLLRLVRNAGAIFLGSYSPEAAGDYATGPNHILPTRGFAASRAGLSVFDFIKMPTIQRLSKKGLERLKETIISLAEIEGLSAHKHSVEVRFKNR